MDSVTIMTPTIDVVIPVYNCEKYIVDAIKSVDRQTFKPASIIVVNDGSTDNTLKRIQLYVLERDQNLARLKVINKANGGLSSARNAGIQAGRSEWIAFLDSDDLWLPDKLQRQVEVLMSSDVTNLGAVYCDYVLIGEDGELLIDQPSSVLDSSVRGKIFERLLFGNFVASSGSGVLCRRTCFETVGLFDESLAAAEDWDMWLRISQDFGFDFVSDRLVKIRRTGNSMSSNRERQFKSDMKVIGKLAAKPKGIYTVKRAAADRILYTSPSFSAFKSLFSNEGTEAGLGHVLFPALHERVLLLVRFIGLRLIWRWRRLK